MNLKTRLKQAEVLLAPGVYDALSALVAEQSGFEALYLSGASIAYTLLGRSDIGLTTASEVTQTLAHITDRVRVPVIVDADTGFGNALNTQRTVRDLERAGAAMIQLEDQTFPKRCGHLDGKRIVPVAEMEGKLRAALDARHSMDTLILARTDAVAVEGFEAALERAERYLACGVDALFIEGMVHVTDLGSDFFQFDEARHELRGERTGMRYQLTDRVTVQVSRVDLDARRIDLRLVREPGIRTQLKNEARRADEGQGRSRLSGAKKAAKQAAKKTAKKAAPKMPDSAKARKAKPAKTAARSGQKKRK